MSTAEQPAVKAVSFDLGDPDTAKNPGPYFQGLRDTCPVARSEDLGGFWIISSYDDVTNAVLAPDTFISGKGVSVPAVTARRMFPLLEQDGPAHSEYRRQLQGWFTRARMNRLEDQIRALVTRLIDGVVDDGRCDIARVLAEPVPSIVTAILLGLPEPDWPWFRKASSDSIRLDVGGDTEGAAQATRDLSSYLAGKLEERRHAPTEDMLTDILGLRIGGEPITFDDAVLLAMFILQAGHETTVGAIGGMLYHVARDADVRDWLISEPQHIENAVEEAVRLEPPLLGLARVAVANAPVRDTVIPEGERVLLMFGSANRDEQMFEDPERFQIGRANGNRHLSFGLGIHRCLGLHLARLEMRVVLEEVLRRMPGLTLESEDGVAVVYTFTRSFRAVPVTW